jgi:hypothetical protein
VSTEQGLDAATDQIARRAGVGVGVASLFRRFPTREDLIAATFTEKMNAYSEGGIVRSCPASHDAGAQAGFTQHLGPVDRRTSGR